MKYPNRPFLLDIVPSHDKRALTENIDFIVGKTIATYIIQGQYFFLLIVLHIPCVGRGD